MKEFYSVLENSEVCIEIEKSKFIAYTKPLETEDEALAFINDIKKKNYDATHNVSAFYIRDNSFYKKYSDDGEPGGTAGLPALQTLVNKNIVDVCIVVTRYFGGVKLGTGGLVRAYTDATIAGLEKSKIILFYEVLEYKLSIHYDSLNKIQYVLDKKNIIIESIIYEEKVCLTILIKDEDTSILDELMNISSGKIEVDKKGIKYIAENGKKIIATKFER